MGIIHNDDIQNMNHVCAIHHNILSFNLKPTHMSYTKSISYLSVSMRSHMIINDIMLGMFKVQLNCYEILSMVNMFHFIITNQLW